MDMIKRQRKLTVNKEQLLSIYFFIPVNLITAPLPL